MLGEQKKGKGKRRQLPAEAEYGAWVVVGRGEEEEEEEEEEEPRAGGTLPAARAVWLEEGSSVLPDLPGGL
jgi:hypothetical protein